MALKARKTQEKSEQLTRLRETPQWKLYYSQLTKAWDEAGIPMDKRKEYVDKLVTMKIDRKNPMASFDEFWKNN